MKWVVLLILVVGGVVWLGRNNAQDYQRWDEARALALDNLTATNHAYEDAQYWYSNCVGTMGLTPAQCYGNKIDLDDAHKEKEKARKQLEELPPMPSIYFGGYFLRH